MATSSHGKKFIESVIDSNLLDNAVDWIRDNLSPDEVFDDKDLKSWANAQECEDIFTTSELQAWAESNGYTKAD